MRAGQIRVRCPGKSPGRAQKRRDHIESRGIRGAHKALQVIGGAGDIGIQRDVPVGSGGLLEQQAVVLGEPEPGRPAGLERGVRPDKHLEVLIGLDRDAA